MDCQEPMASAKLWPMLTREGASVINGDKDERGLQEKAHRWTGTGPPTSLP